MAKKALQHSGQATFIDSSAFKVNLTDQNPDAARPGEPVELTLSVQNIGSNNLTLLSKKRDFCHNFQ